MSLTVKYRGQDEMEILLRFTVILDSTYIYNSSVIHGILICSNETFSTGAFAVIIFVVLRHLCLHAFAVGRSW